MGKILEKYVGSYRFWILVVACTFFAYSIYFAASGIRDSIGMLTNQSLYNSLSQNPWWWMVLFYGSEGASGAAALIVRILAGGFAVVAAFLFWRSSGVVTKKVKKSFLTMFLFETAFFMLYTPYIIAAAVYNLSVDPSLFYFGHTPEALLLFITFIPCLAMVLVVPALLLKLRGSISREAPVEETYKWAGLTGLGYLFVVFWFNFSMMWTGIMVPYPQAYPQAGLDFLLQPANLFVFFLTVFGLLSVALTTLSAVRPLVRKRSQQPNWAALGAALAGLSSYFIVTTIYYFATGGYSAHPSVWYELIGPLHNPNLWVIALILLGVLALLYGKTKKAA